MRHLKKLFPIALMLILPATISAQKYHILDFRAELQDSIIVVHFNLYAEDPVDLGMFCSKDSMRTWVFCKTISGNIERQTFGKKTIIWNYLADNYILDDSLMNNLFFRVRDVEPYAIQRAIEEKRLAKQKAKEERAIAKQIRNEECRLANENLNGHYIGLGSSLISFGYYGGWAGLSYEYRHSIFGANISGGYKTHLNGKFSSYSANVGLKIYLSHKKKIVRNLYFNFLPIGYFGQEEIHTIKYVFGTNENIMQIDDYKYPHIWGLGIFFGYSPVWHVTKKMALGFNVNVGVRVNYQFNRWYPLNYDAGFVIKF
jgi:hypothetical protein